MLSKYLVRARFGIILLTLLSLAIAILNSVDALFVGVLRDQSKGSHAATTDGTHGTQLLALQRFILYIAITSAATNTLSAILGFVAAINPTWLGKYSVCQTIQGLVLISMGGYSAERVRSCEAEFGRLCEVGTTPYYIVIYYGYVVQAAYGFLLITLSLVFAAITPVSEETRVSRWQDIGSC